MTNNQNTGVSTYDFSGIATAYEVLCDDNRVIKKGAFDHQAGKRVPLVWRHNHDDMDNVLGHAILQVNDSPSGMRAFVKLNDTPNGKRAKTLILNGDLTALSIWANQLKENAVNGKRFVEHGVIRELSLVLSGQNRGAHIDEVFVHSSDGYAEVIPDAGIIGSGFEIELPEPEPIVHESDDSDETLGDVLNTFNEKQRLLLASLMAHAAGAFEEGFEMDGASGDAPEVDLSDMDKVLDTFSDKQKDVLAILLEDFKKELNLQHESEEDEEEIMTQSIFTQNSGGNDVALVHEARQKLNSLLANAMLNRPTSLKNAALEHGITDIEYLFPDHQLLGSAAPEFVKNEDAWVERIMNGIHKSPFARTKTRYADITGEDARAQGYVKGNQKIEEVFPILRRSTEPQTVYKLQKLDRDDIIDITEFDAVVWLKSEMRLMQRAELARAVMVGDGRSAISNEKIDPTKIRPIWTDHDVYTIKHAVAANATIAQIIDEVVRSQIDYKGSGRPTLFASSQLIVEMLLLQDLNERRIYTTRESLAAAMNVADIVEVPAMQGLIRDDAGTDMDLLAILVNLNDYNLGMDKMGQTAFFDDFDLDYNKYTYLYESRQSGALTRPHSAVVIERPTTP